MMAVDSNQQKYEVNRDEADPIAQFPQLYSEVLKAQENKSQRKISRSGKSDYYGKDSRGCYKM